MTHSNVMVIILINLRHNIEWDKSYMCYMHIFIKNSLKQHILLEVSCGYNWGKDL